MFGEFKKFIMRGNVLDLAIGVIIGGAFGKIVTSVVNDLITPLISLIVGGVNFGGLHVKIGGTEQAPIYLTYGAFLQALVDFLVIAACIFLMVKAINKVQKPSPAPATTKECPACAQTIPLKASKCMYCTSSVS